MKRKKAAIIAALVCLVVGLAAALVVVTIPSEANAQAIRGGTDYLVVTGKIQANQDAIYIINTADRNMIGWRFEKRGSSGRLKPFRLQDLKNDFGTEKKPKRSR